MGVAKILIVTGILLVVMGIILSVIGRVPLLGRLPGDVRIERENFTFYFPLATSILISVLISVVLWLLSRMR